MALSDVLFEAVQRIERYQRTQPQVYEELRGEIDDLKARMRALQFKLDRPPARMDVALGKLNGALRELHAVVAGDPNEHLVSYAVDGVMSALGYLGTYIRRQRDPESD
jgi:hypothetical protein